MRQTAKARSRVELSFVPTMSLFKELDRRADVMFAIVARDNSENQMEITHHSKGKEMEVASHVQLAMNKWHGEEGNDEYGDDD